MAVVESPCGLNLTCASSAVCVCKGEKEKVADTALITLILDENELQCFNNLLAEVLIGDTLGSFCLGKSYEPLVVVRWKWKNL